MRSFASFLLPALVAAKPVAQLSQNLGGDSVTPTASEITIIAASYSGNGCPQGSVSESISSDGTVITFGFDDFQTYIGPGISITENSLNCQLHLTLNYPSGFQFAVVDSTYHGYALLQAGVVGTFFSTYYFSEDAAATTTTETVINGGGVWATGQIYTKADTVATASYVFSPCGATGILNIDNRIALTSNSTTAVGEITDDDATVAFTQQINLSWQCCPGYTC